MRKLVLLILCTVFTFLFSSCDSYRDELEQLKAEYAKYDEYEKLIEALNEKDFEKAEDFVGAYQVNTFNERIASGFIHEIDVDSTNWGDYFSVCEITEWIEDDFGTTTGFVTHVCIILHEQYWDDIVLQNSSVTFAWEALCSVKNCSVDLDNRILSFENVFRSNSTTFGDAEILEGTISFEGGLCSASLDDFGVVAKIGEIVVIGEYSFEGEMKPVCFDYDNVQITNAEGVLVIREDVQ